VIVGIVIVAVIVALVAVMIWADRRDRANGHVNRRMGDLGATLHDQRRNARLIRNPAAKGAARSPLEIRRGDDRFRRSR
jgi:hypothetical protein